MVNAPAIWIDGRNIGQAQDVFQGLDQSMKNFLDNLLGCKNSYEVGRVYELKAEGHVPCEVAAGVVIGGAVGGATLGLVYAGWTGALTFGIGTVVAIGVGAAIGAIGGYVAADQGCKQWTLYLTDSWDTGSRVLIKENAGMPDKIWTMSVQFEHPGLHTIGAEIESGIFWHNKVDSKIAVIPIPLYLPTSTPCSVLSPSHPSTVFSGECRKKSDGSLIACGLDVVDQRVFPFLKEDAEKAEQVDNMPYDPETGTTNVDKGYYGGFFDAVNTNGYWSWQEKYWVDQSKGIRQIPRMTLTYVQPKDMRSPDISTWKYGKAYYPPIEAEVVRRYFLDKGMMIYDVHMMPIPDSWLAGIPFIVSGSVKRIDDTMTTCSDGQAVSGAVVELLDNEQVVGTAQTIGDGSYVFSYSTMKEGPHKLQARVKIMGNPIQTDKYHSEIRTVNIQGGSFFLTPTGLALIGLIIVGGVVTYIAVSR